MTEATSQPATPAAAPNRVVVTDFNMPIEAMVRFILKWTVATVVAAIALAIPVIVLISALAVIGATTR